ncbi:hypothetical protein TNIN_470571 [Trichonephila inaurata madagascariensis]|uniref:Uncharacterized protein n=1 Tax=Trichonephila inaurata madagascariensis TaxID=2747483 RepID=A0A8X6WL79_9ARAC|nr:hypothetical protein TNIN_470571 [Trichonephila inaurata madagascariensis]
MEKHWFVVFILFGIRLALAQTVLFRAPSSIKTANFGQRVKQPETSSSYALPWSSEEVTPEKTTFPPVVTTQSTISVRQPQWQQILPQQQVPVQQPHYQNQPQQQVQQQHHYQNQPQQVQQQQQTPQQERVTATAKRTSTETTTRTGTSTSTRTDSSSSLPTSTTTQPQQQLHSHYQHRPQQQQQQQPEQQQTQGFQEIENSQKVNNISLLLLKLPLLLSKYNSKRL